MGTLLNVCKEKIHVETFSTLTLNPMQLASHDAIMLRGINNI